MIVYYHMDAQTQWRSVLVVGTSRLRLNNNLRGLDLSHDIEKYSIFQMCGMAHVCISVNRFTAVNAPFLYSSLFRYTSLTFHQEIRTFSEKNTRLLIGAYWMLAIVSTTVFLKMGNFFLFESGIYFENFCSWLFGLLSLRRLGLHLQRHSSMRESVVVRPFPFNLSGKVHTGIMFTGTQISSNMSPTSSLLLCSISVRSWEFTTSIFEMWEMFSRTNPRLWSKFIIIYPYIK